MVVRLVLWSLADSKTTIAELRRYLRDESVEEFEQVSGLRFKAWISDDEQREAERNGDDRGRHRTRPTRAALVVRRPDRRCGREERAADAKCASDVERVRERVAEVATAEVGDRPACGEGEAAEDAEQ